MRIAQPFTDFKLQLNPSIFFLGLGNQKSEEMREMGVSRGGK